MKRMIYRYTALFLAVCMAYSLLPITALCAEAAQEQVQWEAVEAPETGGVSVKEQDTAVRETEQVYADTDRVRVAIVLEQKSLLDRGYSTRGINSNQKALAYADRLLAAQQTLTTQIRDKVLGGETPEVEWNLTLVANLISATVPYGKIDEIAALDGVEEVYLEAEFEVPETTVSSIADVNETLGTATQMTGTAYAWADGYTGAGSRIAIIDTGTNKDHEAFDNGAWEYALAQNAAAAGMTTQAYTESLDLLDAAELTAVLPRLNAKKKLSTLTAAKLIISGKLPFAFNYVDRNLNTGHSTDSQGTHGSHVAGIAAANRYVPRGAQYAEAVYETYAVGQAPDAQLLTMKVFGAKGGAYASDYMAAIEDAILLNCDAVNLSLASAAAGTSATGIASFEKILETLMQSDTVVTVSAGNAGGWSAYSTNGYNYLDSTCTDTVATPGSLTSVLSAGSVESSTTVNVPRLLFNNIPITHREKVYNQLGLSSLDPDGVGTRYTYVVLSGTGTEAEYTGLDVTGKIVVVSRGGTAFGIKHAIAAAHGAAACVIANNTTSTYLIDLSAGTAQIPCVSISKTERTRIIGYSTAGPNGSYSGTVTVRGTPTTTVNYSGNYVMSSFTAWGVPGDLTLKPELTAPGGRVYSVDGATGANTTYKQMSGTSMAAPQLAGMAAVIAQYVRENGLVEKTGMTQRQLVQSLFTGTATPITEAKSGNYYSMLRQGAGLANVGDALRAQAYVLVDGQSDGKVKAELGDDPERTGVYSFRFTVNNLTSTQVSYLLDSTVLTQGYFEDYANADARDAQDASRTALFMDNQTTPVEASVQFTVDGVAATLGSAVAQCDFDADGDVDTADAQALMDYVMGLRQTLNALAYADIDNSSTVDTYDAQLFLDMLPSRTLSVPANGSAEVTVEITLTDAQKMLFDELYTGGAYIEAYLALRAVAAADGALGADLSIPMLAYYGSWTDSAMFDTNSWEAYCSDSANALEQPYLSESSNYMRIFSSKYGYVKIGGNPYTDEEAVSGDKLSLSTSPETSTWLSDLWVTPLRYVQSSRFMLTDAKTGALYLGMNTGSFTGIYSKKIYNSWYAPSGRRNINWTGTAADGETLLPDDTVVNATLQAAPEYNVKNGVTDWDSLGSGSKYTLQLTLDSTAPQVRAITGTYSDTQTLSVEVQDNRYVAAVMLMDANGQQIYETVCPEQTEKGVTSTIVFQIGGYSGTQFLLAVCDYALNETYYRVSLSDRPLTAASGTLRALSAESGRWLSFGENVQSDEYLISLCEREYLAAANADGKAFAITADTLYVFAQNDDFGSARYVASQDFSKLKSLTYCKKWRMLYSIGDGITLVSVNPYNGAMASVDTFTLDGAATITMLAVGSAPDGVFYALTDEFTLYRFTLGASGIENLTLLGAVGEMLGDAGFHLVWSDALQTMLLNNGTQLCALDLQTGAATVYGTLSEPVCCLFSAGGDAAWCGATPDVDAVSFPEQEYQLYVGQSVQLTLRFAPWNLTDTTIVWRSADPAVATVENGLLTGQGDGTTEITAHMALDDSIVATCTADVNGNYLAFTGIAEQTDNTAQLFEWDGTRIGAELQKTAACAQGDVLSAVTDADGNAWVQRTDGVLTQLDVQTGAAVKTVAANEATRLCADLSASYEYGGVYGIYGAKLTVPWKPEQNNAGSVQCFDCLSMLTATNATRFVAVASAGYYVFSWEGEEERYDTERVFLLDNTGNLWIAYIMYYDGEYSCNIEYYYGVAGLEDLSYRVRDGLLRNSLAYSFDDGSLVFAHYNGSGTDFYQLKIDAEGAWSARRLDTTTDGTASAALLRCGRVLPTRRKGAALTLAHGQRIGTLVAAPAEEDNPVVADDDTTPDATSVHTVQVALYAQVQTGSQRMQIDYDTDTLTLLHIHSAMELYAYTDRDGRIDLGCASAAALAADTVLATLTFAYDGDYVQGELALTVSERNGERSEQHSTCAYRAEIGGHDYACISSVAPTCTEPGSEQYRCTKCGNCHSVSIETLGHQYSSKAEGDCIVYTCERCGDSYREQAPAACDRASEFTDVAQDSWYHQAVDFVLDEGLMVGMSDACFSPDGITTRAMIAVIFYRLQGQAAPSASNPYTDVSAGSWYCDAVIWASQTGLMNGYGDGRFGPDDSVTREQLAQVLKNYAVSARRSTEATASLGAFRDGESTSTWAKGSVRWAVAEGILTGKGDGILDPKGAATRAELATILMRYLQK